MKKTILIYGVSSFVGSNLAEQLSADYRVIGTYHTNPVEIPGVTCIPCDVLKKDYVATLTAILCPHYTIYAVGMSSLMECKMYPKRADALNSAGALNCSAASERVGAKFIYLSSGYVLAGEDVLYKEGETPFPTTTYGTTLSATEFYIQRSSLNYLLLRCCPLYGRSYSPFHPNWFEVMQTSLAKNISLHADDSTVTGFLDIMILGRILKSLIEGGVTNRLIQVSSRDFMTRLQFAKLYAQIFKKDEGMVQPASSGFPIETSSKKVVNRATGSKNNFFKLDTSNVEEILGVPMPSIEESLTLTFKRLSS